MDLSGEDVLFHRQLALIRCMDRNPKLGAYVRTLRWTTVDTLPEVMEKECERTWAMQEDKTKRTMRELHFNQANGTAIALGLLLQHY